MTSYESDALTIAYQSGYYDGKKAAQPEQWVTPSEAFNAWWNGEYDDSTNPFTKHSFAYWAFAGWQAALAQPAPVQEFGLTRERFNALEAEITTLQAEWQSALKEIERLKAAQPAQNHVEENLTMVDMASLIACRDRLDAQPVPELSPESLYNIMEAMGFAQRPWVDLTEEEIEDLFQSAADADEETHIRFALAIQAKFKMKNI